MNNYETTYTIRTHSYFRDMCDYDSEFESHISYDDAFAKLLEWFKKYNISEVTIVPRNVSSYKTYTFLKDIDGEEIVFFGKSRCESIDVEKHPLWSKYCEDVKTKRENEKAAKENARANKEYETYLSLKEKFESSKTH